MSVKKLTKYLVDGTTDKETIVQLIFNIAYVKRILNDEGDKELEDYAERLKTESDHAKLRADIERSIDKCDFIIQKRYKDAALLRIPLGKIKLYSMSILGMDVATLYVADEKSDFKVNAMNYEGDDKIFKVQKSKLQALLRKVK